MMTALLLGPLAPTREHARPGDPGCTDPAMPLEQIAASYTLWPKPPTPKAAAAFADLQRLLRGDGTVSPRDLVRRYEILAQDNPADVHVQLALGVLYVTGPELNPKGTAGYMHRVMMHSSLADDRAARAMDFVLDHDPSQWLASVIIERVAVSTREKGRMRQAVSIVKRSLARDPSNVTLQLAWSDLLFAQNKPADVVTFWQANASECVGAMHAKSQALILMGDTTGGAQLYFDALDTAGPGEIDRFYDDARVIFNETDVFRYAGMSADQRLAFLKLFWDRSAASSGITKQARIVQHVQRVAFAEEHYRLAAFRSPVLDVPSQTEAEPNATPEEQQRLYEQNINDRTVPTYAPLILTPWDDRGVVYVRQGKPDTTFEVLEGVGTRIPRNETWVYNRATPPWVLSFVRNVGPDYYWTYAIGCGQALSHPSITRTTTRALLNAAPQSAASTNGALEARTFYLHLADFDEHYDEVAKYCGLASVGGGSPTQFRLAMMKLQQYYRPLMRTVTHTEAAAPNFRHALRMMTAAYTFEDARGRTEVTALSWIPTPELRDVVPVNRLALTMTLVDSTSAPLRHDTVFEVPAVNGSGLLRNAVTWHDVSLRNARLLVLAQDASDGTRGTQRFKQITIPHESGVVRISDVVVGEPDAEGLLVRGDYRIAAVPGHTITSGSDFRLFFELYGLAEGTATQTAIKVVRNEKKSIAELLRLYPGRRDSRELSYAGVAKLDGRGIAVQDATIGGDLLPGAYTITVTVSTARGVVTRNASLQVDAPPKR